MENLIISAKNIQRLKIQGFTGYSDLELSEHRTGIRFAYQLCALCVIIGLLLKSIPIISFLFVMAFIATFHSRHPFDYIYNFGVRHFINKPEVPKRAIQGNIACGVASVFLALIVYFLANGAITAAYIMGGMLLSSAILVSTTDICLPSVVYNEFVKSS